MLSRSGPLAASYTKKGAKGRFSFNKTHPGFSPHNYFLNLPLREGDAFLAPPATVSHNKDSSSYNPKIPGAFG